MIKNYITIIGMFLVGCGDADAKGITSEEAARRFLPAYCAKLHDCVPDEFFSLYGTTDQCTEKLIALVPAADKAKTSACSANEVDQCVAAMRGTACASSAAQIPIPDICKKC
jgi:hypothetical protein